MTGSPKTNLTESMFYVLMALHREPMCGIDIAAYIEQRTRGRIRMGPATLYTILGKFMKQKWIHEIATEGRKRTYAIRKAGMAAYEHEIRRLRLCLADAESQTQEGQSIDE